MLIDSLVFIETRHISQQRGGADEWMECYTAELVKIDNDIKISWWKTITELNDDISFQELNFVKTLKFIDLYDFPLSSEIVSYDGDGGEWKLAEKGILTRHIEDK